MQVASKLHAVESHSGASSMTELEPQDRRGFLLASGGFFAALPLLGGLVAALRSAFGPSATEGPARLPLCKLGEVPETGVVQRSIAYQLRRGPRVESVAERVFVTREADQVVAFSGRCTHLGCPVHLDEENEDAPFVCRCHSGRFAKDGSVLEGPPPRPLDRLQLEVPDDPEADIQVIR